MVITMNRVIIILIQLAEMHGAGRVNNAPLRSHLPECNKDFLKEQSRGVLKKSLSESFKKLPIKDTPQRAISTKLEVLSI